MEKLNLDPFEIEYITLTHSILEPNGLRIKTPAGCNFTYR
jgi:ribonuclease J